MKPTQEPKYNLTGSNASSLRWANRVTGELVFDDEPVFILRASDILAIHTLHAYLSQIRHDGHRQAVADRLQDFERFKGGRSEQLGPRVPRYAYGMVDDESILLDQSGAPVPADEPVFLFLGRDRHAGRAIGHYLGMTHVFGDIDNVDYRAVREAARDVLVQFRRYAEQYPERMKEPDTNRPEPRDDEPTPSP